MKEKTEHWRVKGWLAYFNLNKTHSNQVLFRLSVRNIIEVTERHFGKLGNAQRGPWWTAFLENAQHMEQGTKEAQLAAALKTCHAVQQTPAVLSGQIVSLYQVCSSNIHGTLDDLVKVCLVNLNADFFCCYFIAYICLL